MKKQIDPYEELPVWVQYPCKPPGMIVGKASANLSAEEVAKLVRIPKGCFMEGKIMKRQGQRIWSLVAEVSFSPR